MRALPFLSSLVLPGMILASACSAPSGGGGPPGGAGAGTAIDGSGGSGPAAGGTNSGTGGAIAAGGELVFGSGGMAGAGACGTASSEGGAAGAGACGQVPTDTPRTEECDNGLDDDLDGFVDEKCSCSLGTTQECFDGPPSQASLPNCHKGTQTCQGSAEFPGWSPCTGSGCGEATPPSETCDNGVDDDCDGLVDEGCYFDADVNIDGDCLGIPCPPQAPNPVGCNIQMEGGDSRGCVAHTPGNSAVYFQEGDACPLFPGCTFCGDVGHISGTLRCSSQPDPVVLGPDNCAINKPDAIYPNDPSGCP